MMTELASYQNYSIVARLKNVDLRKVKAVDFSQSTAFIDYEKLLHSRSECFNLIIVMMSCSFLAVFYTGFTSNDCF